MKSKLLLYFDTNIIVSVSCDANGRTHETEFLCYTSFPDQSHIEFIREFYQKTTGVNTIDTHYVFAETIELSFRKKILHSFSKEGMKPISFTGLPVSILTAYALKQNPGERNSFGDNVVIIYSNDESLRLTGAIFDGNVWRWNVSNIIIPKVGNSPLKRSLVECLIDERDKRLSAIDERNREKEIENQMQFVDEWLAIYKNTDSKEDLIIDFKFSFENTYVKLRIPKRDIEASYEKTLAPAISKIAEYKEKVCSNSIKYAIFVGPAFEEESFTFKVKTALDCHEQFSVIPYTRLNSVLSKYLETCDLVDDLTQFDKISKENERLYKNSVAWIQYAQELTEFNNDLNVGLKELVRRVAADGETLDALNLATNSFMATSAFDEARNALNRVLLPSDFVKDAIQESRLLLAKRENMEGAFAKLESVDGARLLIRKIQNNADAIKDEILKSESHIQIIDQKNERIDFCEEHYEEYLDLRRKFHGTSDIRTKKELITQMKKVTDEPMPELKLRQVFAEIQYSKEKVRVGFFKKKKVLNISVMVKNNETLPCDALFNISNKVQIRSSEGDSDCLAYEIAKGENSFHVTIDSLNSSLDFSKTIYCYLFVGKNVLDKAAIKCESIIIK